MYMIFLEIEDSVIKFVPLIKIKIMKNLIKKITIVLLTSPMFFMLGCVKNDGETSWKFENEPAIIASSSPTTLLSTRSGAFLAPMLNGYDKGDCVLASFKVNYTDQTFSNTITEMYSAIPVGRYKVDITPNDPDSSHHEYVIPSLAFRWGCYFDNLIFAEVFQKEKDGKDFRYRGNWTSESIVRYYENFGYIPTIYVSGKASPTESELSSTIAYPCALDLSAFIEACKEKNLESGQPYSGRLIRKEPWSDDIPAKYNVLRLSVKYLSGTGSNGEPIYSYANNGIIKIALSKADEPY